MAKEAELVVAELKQKYPKQQVQSYQADLTIVANVEQVFAQIREDFGGKLDIVINTVGMVLKKALVDVSEQEYDRMFAVNSKSAFFINQQAAKAVSDGGKIINLVTGLLGAYTPFYTTYQGSKAPVEWFTKGLSKELMSRRISVNAIAPGPMDTTFFYPVRTTLGLDAQPLGSQQLRTILHLYEACADIIACSKRVTMQLHTSRVLQWTDA